ncbi:MAG: histidine kinase, partial [Spirochaetes bacterium]|nr:histidine kinase [Spirochaetota bacterium]
EQDRIASNQSRTVLQIASKTINLFRSGFNEETTRIAAGIIKDMTHTAAVAFTSCHKILTHVGTGSDHHFAGSELMTGLTQQVIIEGETRIANNKKEISCSHPHCKLKSGIIVPLKEKKKIIGTLKLYQEREMAITSVDVRLAEGLANLFSTQIELARIEEQAQLLKQAELNALQAQINPHFLFNAVNTIVSLIRTKPNQARDLLIKLGAYFRKSLYNNDEITLADEISNISNYLEIEKARFGDSLSINIHISEGLNCKIPPFTIQPLVENALKHGLLSRVGGGAITISAGFNEGDLEIEVKDNGVGIENDKLKTLLDYSHQTKSVALKNVHKRLLHKYGFPYGLSLESLKGKGTTVSVKIPVKVS